jgi:hypothetical protein
LGDFVFLFWLLFGGIMLILSLMIFYHVRYWYLHCSTNIFSLSNRVVP